MNRRTFLETVPSLTILAAAGSAFAEDAAPAAAPAAPAPDLAPIILPPHESDGGKSVLAALCLRRTNRSIREDPLPPQVLSNLLWAAFGVNRQAGGPRGRPGRTAASASNSQEIDLYVFLPEGAYLYEAVPHRLAPVLAGDQRARLGDHGRGGRAAKAPVNIVYVADMAKFAGAPFQEPGLRDPEIQKSYYNIGAGLIAGNVYLFAASLGLAAWFHNCDKPGLAAALKLRPDQRVLYAHTVGYPV
ncbi:MAG: nitroreductase family protein [Acidobacteria bacterium]|nr:nitroreductase family protein [Acidobacteriota bacterium]